MPRPPTVVMLVKGNVDPVVAFPGIYRMLQPTVKKKEFME
jgi:hypothetical protein